MTDTSGHLPECLNDDDTYGLRGLCICDELRACEQRVLSLNPVALGVLIAQRARERALDAAREAVAALPARYKVRGDLDTYGPYNAGRMYMKDAALAAIDALKEKP